MDYVITPMSRLPTTLERSTDLDMSSESTTNVEKCQDLWYQDGTVVLQAESLQFRIYGGILAENSPVFRDMFTLAQPQGDELSEGCPVVRLHDSKSDLYHFLKSLHSAGSAVRLSCDRTMNFVY